MEVSDFRFRKWKRKVDPEFIGFPIGRIINHRDDAQLRQRERPGNCAMGVEILAMAEKGVGLPTRQDGNPTCSAVLLRQIWISLYSIQATRSMPGA